MCVVSVRAAGDSFVGKLLGGEGVCSWLMARTVVSPSDSMAKIAASEKAAILTRGSQNTGVEFWGGASFPYVRLGMGQCDLFCVGFCLCGGWREIAW